MFLNITSKTRPLYNGNCTKVNLITQSGEITVLDGHENLISALATGAIKFTTDGKEQTVFSDEGFLEVATNNGQTKVSVLANQARLKDEVIKEEIEKAITAGQQEMQAKKGTVSESVLIQLEKQIRFEKFLKDQTDL